MADRNDDTNRIEQINEAERRKLARLIARAENIDRARYTRTSVQRVDQAAKSGREALLSPDTDAKELQERADKIQEAIKLLRRLEKELEKPNAAGSTAAMLAGGEDQLRKMQEAPEEAPVEEEPVRDRTAEDEEERRRIEKREREIREAREKKEELDRKRMTGEEESTGGRGIGRGREDVRYRAQYVTERTKPEDPMEDPGEAVLEDPGIDDGESVILEKRETKETDYDRKIKEQYNVGERGEYRQVTRDDHLQDLSPEDRRLIEREERIPPKHDPEAEETLTPAEKMAQDMQRAGTNLEQTIENEGLGAATSEVEEATGGGVSSVAKNLAASREESDDQKRNRNARAAARAAGNLFYEAEKAEEPTETSITDSKGIEASSVDDTLETPGERLIREKMQGLPDDAPVVDEIEADPKETLRKGLGDDLFRSDEVFVRKWDDKGLEDAQKKFNKEQQSRAAEQRRREREARRRQQELRTRQQELRARQEELGYKDPRGGITPPKGQPADPLLGAGPKVGPGAGAGAAITGASGIQGKAKDAEKQVRTSADRFLDEKVDPTKNAYRRPQTESIETVEQRRKRLRENDALLQHKADRTQKGPSPEKEALDAGKAPRGHAPGVPETPGQAGKDPVTGGKHQSPTGHPAKGPLRTEASQETARRNTREALPGEEYYHTTGGRAPLTGKGAPHSMGGASITGAAGLDGKTDKGEYNPFNEHLKKYTDPLSAKEEAERKARIEAASKEQISGYRRDPGSLRTGGQSIEDRLNDPLERRARKEFAERGKNDPLLKKDPLLKDSQNLSQRTVKNLKDDAFVVEQDGVTRFSRRKLDHEKEAALKRSQERMRVDGKTTEEVRREHRRGIEEALKKQREQQRELLNQQRDPRHLQEGRAFGGKGLPVGDPSLPGKKDPLLDEAGELTKRGIGREASLSSSKGILLNGAPITSGKHLNAITHGETGKIRLQKGEVVDQKEIIKHTETGEMRIGRAAGIAEKGNIADGILKKEDRANLRMRKAREDAADAINKSQSMDPMKAAQAAGGKRLTATEQYTEAANAKKGTIRLGRDGSIEKRVFGKEELDTGPTSRMNNRFEILGKKNEKSLGKKNLKMRGPDLPGANGAGRAQGMLAKQAEQARLAHATRTRYFMKNPLATGVAPGFNVMGAAGQAGGLAKAKVLLQSVAKKAISATLITGVAVGGTVGVGGAMRHQDSNRSDGLWYPVPANVSEAGINAMLTSDDGEGGATAAADEKSLTQFGVEMIQARMLAYIKQVLDQPLTPEEIKKALIDKYPLKEIAIRSLTIDGAPYSTAGITWKNLDEFEIEHTYTGTMRYPATETYGTDADGNRVVTGRTQRPSRASSHTENIGVIAKSAEFEYVDRNDEVIGKKWFLLDEMSNIRFPDGSAGEAAGRGGSSIPPPLPGAPEPPPIEENPPVAQPHINNQSQMDIMLNMVGATETGGQVYGKRDYSNIIYATAGAEVTMTIGWNSLYSDNGRDWLIRFKQEQPQLFAQNDPSGEVNRSLNFSWGATRFSASSTWVNSVKQMLTTPQGKALQDAVASERIAKHWNYCAQNYTDNLRACMWYAQLAELGGGGYRTSPVDQVFQALNGDYSQDNIYARLKERNSSPTSIGGSFYNSRHLKYYNWISQFVPADERVDLSNIQVTGAGALVSGGTIGSPSAIAGQILFLREMISLGTTGAYYLDPAKKEDYEKYLVDMVDFAIARDGADIEMFKVPTGGTVTWHDGNGGTATAAEMGLDVQISVPVLCDLKILEDNDRNFTNSWDVLGADKNTQTYGDLTVQSYIALHSDDFDKIFNVNISPIALGGSVGGGFYYGGDSFGGLTGLPYVDWAIQIANNPAHGYSQVRRYGNPDYDCSSLVWYSLKQAGFNNIGTSPFTTHYMHEVLGRAGFTAFRIGSASDVQRGDILWRTGHTEIYLGNGQTVGAHIDEYDGISGPNPGDQTGHEISVGRQNPTSYSWAFRPPSSYFESLSAKNTTPPQNPQQD